MVTVVVSAVAKAANSSIAIKNLKILLISSIYEDFALNCWEKTKNRPRKEIHFLPNIPSWSRGGIFLCVNQ
jgi:hypothetical protein